MEAAVLERLVRLVTLAYQQTGLDPLGHMRLATKGQHRDVLLADRTDLSSKELSLLDWRTAPLAEVFFNCEPGDNYEIDIDGRNIDGVLLERHLLGCEAGKLLWAQTDGGRHSPSSEPEEMIPLRNTVLCPRGTPTGLRLFPAELDERQLQAVRLDRGRPVLILGQAGTGKTTVAVARLAGLLAVPGNGKRMRAAVMVPTEGLRRLYLRLLAAADVHGVEVHVFDKWAHREACRLLDWVPRKLASDTPAAVIALKRHPSVACALERWVLAQRQGQPMEVDREYLADVRPKGYERSAVVEGISSETLTNWFDLFDMFGDERFVFDVVTGSAGALSERHAEAVRRRTGRQFSPDSRSAFAHVHPDHLLTLDGRELDDGTPDEDAGTLDAEDPPILLHLQRLRSGAIATTRGRLRQYDILVADEAQELAPLELALLREALRPGGSLIAAGDSRQQVDPTAYFDSWPQTMRALGAGDSTVIELEITYRCPASVMELACRVMDDPMPAERSPLDDGSLVATGFAHDLAQALRLTEVIEELCARHPEACAAIVCRDPEAAARWHFALRHCLRPRLVVGGEFDFEAGVCITFVSEVKGLEFDVVIVPDADERSYPDTPESRRALYVAVTRAVHGLWLCWTGAPSPILTHAGMAGVQDAPWM
jgi:hypothetical protein